MRGRVRGQAGHRRPDRKTPARAGTRGINPLTHQPLEEDPRACGDESGDRPAIAAPTGRPPRVRGRGLVDFPEGQGGWKTPARAGTRFRRRTCGTGSPEDPRACGDETNGGCPVQDPKGRPPRVRGRARRGSRRPRHARKTPARAGTRAVLTPDAPPIREDPRACGDEEATGPPLVRRIGRPPRVRGREVGEVDQGDGPGKTPARAGTSRRR